LKDAASFPKRVPAYARNMPSNLWKLKSNIPKKSAPILESCPAAASPFQKMSFLERGMTLVL
jgi:hypothetical protein